MNIEKKFYHVPVFENLGRIKKQKADLMSNASAAFDLRTPFEKQNALQQLEQSKQSLQPKVISALNTDWGIVKQEYQDLKRAKVAAADRSAKKWDFQRLEYSRKSARDFISRAGLTAIEKKYNEIELSGDTHALRGFVEEGAAILEGERNFSASDTMKALELRKDFERMSEQLTVTSEMRDLAKQGEILTGKIATLYDATHQAQSEFASMFEPGKDGNGDYMVGQGQADPFRQMTEGVNVKRNVDPATLAIKTEVDVDWDTSNAGTSVQWKAVEVNGQYYRTPA